MRAPELSTCDVGPRDRWTTSGDDAGVTEACCLLVMEAGSRWPSWLEAPAAGRVVAQNSEESVSEFASRVLRAIRSVQTSEQELETVVIAAGWTSEDEQSLVGRSLIAKAAARAMNGRPGMLLLSGHDRLPETDRHELLATACALANQLVGTGIDVRVRFETARTGPRTARPTSGVFERAEPVIIEGSPELEAGDGETPTSTAEAVAHAEAPMASQTRPIGAGRRRSKRGRQDPAQVA